ncbi:MAG: thioesterase family protein [Thermodesulfobacteriota bacterium]
MSFAFSVTEIRVRGFHVDVFGVVNHAWHIHFFEEARWSYFDERAALQQALRSAGIAHSVVSMVVEYRRPARFGDILRIETRVSRAGSRSITFDQRAYVGPSRDIAVEAQVVNVFFRTHGGQAIGVHDEVFNSWGELRDLAEPESGG